MLNEGQELIVQIERRIERKKRIKMRILTFISLAGKY